MGNNEKNKVIHEKLGYAWADLKNENIMMQASYINQYRLHRGYHYPRSIETAKSSLAGEKSFREFYSDSLINTGKIMLV